MRILPLFTHGSYCPRCGNRTERVRTRIWFKPVRWFLPDVKRRACTSSGCFWRGFGLPEHVQDATHAAAAR